MWMNTNARCQGRATYEIQLAVSREYLLGSEGRTCSGLAGMYNTLLLKVGIFSCQIGTMNSMYL
jgi:hypothetical protein